MRTLGLIPAFATLALAACDPAPNDVPDPPKQAEEASPPAAAPPAAKAPKVTIENYVDDHLGPDRLHTICEPIGYGKVAIEPDLTMPLHLKSEPGTKIAIGPHEATIGADGTATLTLELAPVVRTMMSTLELRPSYLRGGRVAMPVVIEGKDGVKTEAEFAVDSTAAMLRFVELAANGPLLLEGEEPGPGGGRSTMFINGTIDASTVGEPKNFADVDLVGFGHSTKTEKTCGPYGSGSHRETLLLIVWDKEFMVVDRRSGKKLGTKTFRGSRKCPRSIMSGDAAGHADYDQGKVRKWMMGFLKT